MKRILLIATTMMFVAAAFAQPQRGTQGPRAPHKMMPQQRGPRVMMKMVKLTDEEVAVKFARTLRLDEAKANAFTQVFVEFLNNRAEVEKQYPVQQRRMFQHPMHKKQPTETQVEEMKTQHKQMMAKHKALFALNKDYRPQFVEVLNGRKYHQMMRLLDDRRMFVKFVRITPADDNNPTEEEQLVTPRTDGLADAIENIGNDKTKGEWFSVNGIRQQGQPSQPGIYVKNGKKVLVK